MVHHYVLYVLSARRFFRNPFPAVVAVLLDKGPAAQPPFLGVGGLPVYASCPYLSRTMMMMRTDNVDARVLGVGCGWRTRRIVVEVDEGKVCQNDYADRRSKLRYSAGQVLYLRERVEGSAARGRFEG